MACTNIQNNINFQSGSTNNLYLNHWYIYSRRHGELIAKNEHYAKMWSQQFNSAPDSTNGIIQKQEQPASDSVLIPKHGYDKGNCSEILENHSG